MTFTNTEKAIINALYKANRPLTTGQVAEKSQITWVTASLRLKDLEKYGHVSSTYAGNAYYWYLVTSKTKTKSPVEVITVHKYVRKKLGRIERVRHHRRRKKEQRRRAAKRFL